MPLKLIVIYAAYGDALLLETPDQKYWLIDGGPINPRPTIQIREDEVPLVAYYQYLKRALYRYRTPSGNPVINSLSGIIVTHPDGDHMDGIYYLLRNDISIPAGNFTGPIILNATFFRRDLKGAFIYPLTQFLNTVDNSRLGFSKLSFPNDAHVPSDMINFSLTNLYKMVRGGFPPIRENLPQTNQIVWPWDRSHLDPSEQNWSSIITIWGDAANKKLNLVTTGDGLPAPILKAMAMLTPPNTKPVVDIFKVPHHGSEYNNQWADDAQDYVDSGDTDAERKFFFCLALLAMQYDQLAHINPPPPPNAHLNMFIFRHGILGGGPMLDWTSANENTNCVQFQDSLERLSGAFRDFLIEFVKTARIDNQSFNLLNDVGLRDFADALLARYNNRKAQIIVNGRIANSTLGSSVVSLPRFGIKGFKVFRVRFLNAAKRELFTNAKHFESLFESLASNSLGHLRKARLVQNFYSKFTAHSYVISGNKVPHGHPNPNVLAGLMAHLILSQSDINPRRIYVTDGASVQVDYVHDLVKDLLSRTANARPPGRWNEKVRLYCLATDFLAEVSADHSANVGGVKEIDFSVYESREHEDYYTFLNNQFLQAKPFDIPRAAISHTSQFYITILSEKAPNPKFLDMDANGILGLAALGVQPRFNLRYIDHNTMNLSRWEFPHQSHFHLFTDAAQNRPLSDLVLWPTAASNPSLADRFVYKDVKDRPLEKLHLENNVVSFKTDSATQATVRFQRIA